MSYHERGGERPRLLPPLPSRAKLCRAVYGKTHRFWPVAQKPGLSICLACGCDEWLPRVKQWPVWKQRGSRA